MIWNKKRIKDMQVYKEKGDGFLIVFSSTYGYLDCFCGIWKNALPQFSSFCHSTCSYDFLYENCYPVSQRQLKKHPEWYEFFTNYFNEV